MARSGHEPLHEQNFDNYVSSRLYWEGEHPRGFWQREESVLWRYRLSR
jgi:hypothetical protein